MHTTEFTFSTGITAQVGKVSPTLIADIERAIRQQWADKEPRPPVEQVDMGAGPVELPNPHDPDYLAAKAEFDRELDMEVTRRWDDIIIRRAVQLAVDEEALNAVAADYAAVMGEPLPLTGDRKVDYVRRVAIGSWQDIAELRRIVTQRSIPTREAVQAHAATFQG